MICISINQESRRLALVDMLNAAAQCDLLEIRLDRFGMAPEIAELLAHKPAPVIMSCRRKEDGGYWDGSEAERLALLRQCVISQADYVEIELDAADEIRRLPPTKRVICCNVQPGDKASDIQSQYAKAQLKDPDVIKLTTEVKTPEQAWPFVQILAKSPVPTVVMGVGKPGVMLTVMGKKIGAPWTYAALEKGMEAYPDQPSVRELEEIYHYKKIDKGTRLIGVTGFDERSYATVAGLNAALAHLDLKARCLPLAVGSAKLFDQIIDAVKLASVVVDANHQKMLLTLADKKHATADYAQLVDLLLQKDGKWNGYFTSPQGSVAALAAALKAKVKADDPIKDRMVIIVGIDGTAKTIAAELSHRGASVILASRQKKAVAELAQKLNCRHIQFEALYTTTHDTLILCDDEKDDGGQGLHASSLKPGITFMDLMSPLKRSELLIEAAERGCNSVVPRDVLLNQLALQAKMITGKPVPVEVIAKAAPSIEE